MRVSLTAGSKRALIFSLDGMRISRGLMKRFGGALALVAFSIAFRLSGAPASQYVPPISGTPRINANFGAFGPGPVTDPSTYFSGQYHLGVDLAGDTKTTVRAPVDGTIIYHHQLRNSPREVRLMDTFVVIRGNDGRDYIFGHIDCTACAKGDPIGDDGAYPRSSWRPVKAGEVVGKIADLKAEAARLQYKGGVGNHLHFGVVEGQIVDSEGRLKAAYRGGDWGRLLYDSAEDANPVTARAKAKANGFIDPLNLGKPAPASSPAPVPTTAPTRKQTPSQPTLQPRPDVRPVPPNLMIGAYVYFKTPCAQASNSSLQWWNGEYFSAGRMNNVVPVYVSPGQYTSRTKNFETGQIETIKISVINSREYSMYGARYRYCPDSALPATWRNSTPKASTGASPGSGPVNPRPAQPQAALRLTAIEDRFSGAACRVSLTRSGNAIVAGTDYFEDADAWHIGIDGRDYRLMDTSRQSPDSVLVNNNRSIVVKFKRGRRVWVSSDPNYPAETHEVTISVQANGKTGTFTAFQTCGDG